MKRIATIICAVLCAALLTNVSSAGAAPPITAAAHSLCLEAQSGCFDFVMIPVRLGAGAGDIVGAQFTINYDPAVFAFVEIAPGDMCDANSPFTLEVFESVDPIAGSLFYAVGVNVFAGDSGTPGPATVACLRLLPLVASDSEVCLLDGVNPFETLLSDDTGASAPVVNSGDCPTEQPHPALSCVTVVQDKNCVCTPNTDDCNALDDQCRIGVCDAQSGRCLVQNVNEGGFCNDGDQCTLVDTCIAGVCVGSECNMPSLCVEAEEECLMPQGIALARVVLGAGDPVILGGQFSIQYDAANLELIDIAPGATCDPESPFTQEIFQLIDEVDGEIFYAFSAFPGAPGTSGPATLACLSFRLRGIAQDPLCLFEAINPMLTRLASETGNSVPIDASAECAGGLADPLLSCDDVCVPIPAASSWTLLILALSLLVLAKRRYGVHAHR